MVIDVPSAKVSRVFNIVFEVLVIAKIVYLNAISLHNYLEIGDCGSDNDCDKNLYCYQRFGYELVPGCAGQGKQNV